MRIKYEDWRPSGDASAIVRQANLICSEYRQQGYDLTLRQLYYQFVARDLIPNTQQSYKRLGDIISKARMAGLLDWRYIVDRTRNLRGNSHWDDPQAIIDGAARSYALDKWDGQPRRVEVWVEKEALAGIVGQVAERYDVDWFSCRGYVSQSELWRAARRHLAYIAGSQGVTVLHLGDHDPSGKDMTRDIRKRLEQFIDADWLAAHADEFEGDRVRVSEIRASMRKRIHEGAPLEVRRIALNMDQIEEYGPPPNPAKLTDSRAEGYVAEYGYDSWELDALDPTTLADLIAEHIESIRDPDLYEARQETENRQRQLLNAAASRWSEVVELLDGAS